MFVVNLMYFKSYALSHDPSGDHVMPRTEMHLRAQASQGNITVLSHLKCNLIGKYWLLIVTCRVFLGGRTLLKFMDPACNIFISTIPLTA